MTLSHVLYRSLGRLEQFEADCANILATARQRNPRLGLTGFLHAEDGIFVQWLEGPTAALDPLIDTIFADPRHREIDVFGRGPITARSFPDWSMAYSEGREAALFEWIAQSEVNLRDRRAYGASLRAFLRQQAS